jgi:hypothetical protein
MTFPYVKVDAILNDLWEFNPFTNEWTWMAGSSIAGSDCVVA